MIYLAIETEHNLNIFSIKHFLRFFFDYLIYTRLILKNHKNKLIASV